MIVEVLPESPGVERLGTRIFFAFIASAADPIRRPPGIDDLKHLGIEEHGITAVIDEPQVIRLDSDNLVSRIDGQ